jgi:pimeloyl-ACP methyl ester carboxylesterase
MNKKKIFNWIKIIIILYCLAGIGLYYMQEKLIFHPEVLAKDYQFDFKIPFKELNIPYNRQSNMNIVQFRPADSSMVKGVVLYFHGNGQNIVRYAAHAPLFTKNNYEVWMIDYPGYGKSTGERSEQMLYDWALIFYKLARSKFPKDSIVLYGRSLGTGIASQLASVRDCKALILEAPYYSLPSLAATKAPIYPVNTMIRYKFPTYQYLQNVAAPVTIFHGTEDDLIPISQAEKLKPLLKSKDQFVPVENAEHNNVSFFQQYTTKLDSLLR